MNSELEDGNESSDTGSRGASRSRKRASRASSARPQYQLDMEDVDVQRNEEDDEEYHDEDEDLGDDRQAGDDDVEEVVVPSVSRRGRPSKRRRGDNTDDNKSETEDSRSGSAVPPGMFAKRPHHAFPVDSSGAPLSVINEEYDLPDDPEGETKITEDGDLLGNRQFLVRSFTVKDKGQRKYMLSTEPARAVGFRDSYLFFQYHPNLYKFILSQDQKNELIDRGVLPYSYRSRQIALVTARSVFKEFGAKIIANGRNITDDYYATRLREEGRVVEGTYVKDQSKRGSVRGSTGLEFASTNSINPAKNAVEFFVRRNQNQVSSGTGVDPSSKMTATNWLYQHAAACSRLNSDMYYDRVRVLLIERQGLRDPYTNTLHIPGSTQSSRVVARYRKPSNKQELANDHCITYETVIEDQDLTRNKTGLLDVPRELFDDIVSDDVREAILEQQTFEKAI